MFYTNTCSPVKPPYSAQITAMELALDRHLG